MRGTCGKYLRKSPNQNGNRNTRRNNEDIDQLEKKKDIIVVLSLSISNHRKYKWIVLTSQKTQSGWMG